ncbi:protein phosphatase 2C domain-containing protein [Lapillicoccus jejuensis]|uniref:Serine/threonine protein phosphatase PrpC n=1 Tax=Lapillicoccus jejuensis TaxID=402171 RepID=A0A542DWT2_9MICO|nr:protein phosphatase 2C domain-containing protein [Lapillicoccus jejuensis]TQJ07549.1 serine/threonine protein phosphatase PrpC [Lapillicoccus jejuensis]
MSVTTEAGTCPACGASYGVGAQFCEACGTDFTGGAAGAPAAATRTVPADPVTAEAGEESPLDVGWTGPVSRRSSSELTGPVAAPAAVCAACGEGHFEDGYCDVCGAKEPDPRDHYEEAPAAWVAGVCDIGRRHHRNEDALALDASPEPLRRAALVVCDGVSNSVDSHVASLAASRAARDVLDDPVPRGAGTRTAFVANAVQRLTDAVLAARDAVVATAAPTETPLDSPPSCTLVAALVGDGVAVVGNVGDSRAYWLPDDPAGDARQLTRDDSFAAEQIAAGVPREEAETGKGAHAITRWLGVDAPEDLTPHTADLDLDRDGWLLVCSDGLWNYCSDAEALRLLVADTVADLGADGHHPPTLARALVDWANDRGGIDNISVALARVGPTSAPDQTDPIDDTKDTP